MSRNINDGQVDIYDFILPFGHYPERILADKIYRSRNNREFCKTHGIQLSGPKLGRPGKNHAEEIRRELQEIGGRNVVECKFGNGKRKLGLSLIMAKLQITIGFMIGKDISFLNMDRMMRKEISLMCAFLRICIIPMFPGGWQLTTGRISATCTAI